MKQCGPVKFVSTQLFERAHQFVKKDVESHSRKRGDVSLSSLLRRSAFEAVQATLKTDDHSTKPCGLMKKITVCANNRLPTKLVAFTSNGWKNALNDSDELKSWLRIGSQRWQIDHHIHPLFVSYQHDDDDEIILRVKDVFFHQTHGHWLYGEHYRRSESNERHCGVRLICDIANVLPLNANVQLSHLYVWRCGSSSFLNTLVRAKHFQWITQLQT